jgi:pheophorbide a oxygenase
MEPEDAAVAARAAAAPLPLDGLPAADAAGAPWFEVAPWYVRDLEVDKLPLLENSADPSHVHFAHAGALGAPSRAGPLAVREVASDSAALGGPDEIRLACDDPQRATFSDLRLRPPCALWAASENAPGGDLALLYFVVPVAPGRSLMSLPLSTNAAFRVPARLFRAAPWLRHLNNHEVSAQDAALLHRKGAALAAPNFAARGWRRGFYLPTKADGGVAALRRWLEAAEGGGVQYGPSVAAAPRCEALPGAARERLFDNWAQHTRSCPSCLRALGRVRAARSAAAAGLAALALAAARAAGRGAAAWGARGRAALAAGALALAIARAALGCLERAFMATQWRHADNRSLLAGLAAVARRAAAPAAPKAI